MQKKFVLLILSALHLTAAVEIRPHNGIGTSRSQSVEEPSTLPTELFKPIVAPTEKPLLISSVPVKNVQIYNYPFAANTANTLDFTPVSNGNFFKPLNNPVTDDFQNWLTRTRIGGVNNEENLNTPNVFNWQIPSQSSGNNNNNDIFRNWLLQAQRNNNNNNNNAGFNQGSRPAIHFTIGAPSLWQGSNYNSDLQQAPSLQPLSSYSSSSGSSYSMSSDMDRPIVHNYEYETRNGVPTKWYEN